MGPGPGLTASTLVQARHRLVGSGLQYERLSLERDDAAASASVRGVLTCSDATGGSCRSVGQVRKLVARRRKRMLLLLLLLRILAVLTFSCPPLTPETLIELPSVAGLC